MVDARLPRGAVEHLHRLAMTDSDPEVAQTAINGLTKIASLEAVGSLIALLTQPARRENAVVAIARLGDENLELLGRALTDPDVEVRHGIVDALTRMKRPQASEFLTIALQDNDISVRLAASRALSLVFTK